MAWTTDDHVTKVRLWARLPDEAFSVAEVLLVSDDIMRTMMVPMLEETKEGYGIETVDATVVVGQSDYDLPPFATGAALRDVSIGDGSGNFRSIPHVTYEQREHYRDGGSVWWPAGFAFAMEGERLVLLPTPTSAADFTLRLAYYRRPSQLVAVSSTGKITSLDDSDSVTLDNAPSAWTTGDTFDIIKGSPHFDLRGADLAATSVGTSFDFTADYPTDTAVGDYVCKTGESSIVQLPAEVHSLFAVETAYALARIRGYDKRAEGLLRHLDGTGRDNETGMRQHVLSLLQPRVEGAAKLVLNRNSALRRRRFGRWQY